MKTLVVCLDGTDQTKTQIPPKSPTNIARMFDALGRGAKKEQYGSWEIVNKDVKGKYLPGVGTQEDGALQALGDLFGDGLPELIVRGYTFLSREWQAGDRIVISGFSRGATAARALAGLIVARGLLDASRYDPSDKQAAYARAISAWYGHRSKVLAADRIRRAELDLKLRQRGGALPSLQKIDFTPPPEIEAVAVFDTVSSLGLPHLDGRGVSFDFEIIDTKLDPRVKHGFHALAADETRQLFKPTYWDARDGVEQMIFPGCHSNVGGGFADIALSDVALEWMLGMLAGIGVVLDGALITPRPAGRPDGLIQDDARSWPLFGLLCTPREFPGHIKAHPSLIERCKLDPDRITPHRAAGRYAPAGKYEGGQPLVP